MATQTTIVIIEIVAGLAIANQLIKKYHNRFDTTKP